MRLLFTICGRAGSKGYRNKNIKNMNGVSLVYYTLATIKNYKDTHQNDVIDVALNTDSQELIEICNKQSEIPIICVHRKAELADDLSPKVAVIQDTYTEMKRKRTYDAVIDLDITSPIRSAKDIENAIGIFLTDERYDVVYSVVNSRRSPYFNMVQVASDGFCHRVCDADYTTRQQAPICYELNASIYVYNPKFLDGIIDKVLSKYNCGKSVMRDYLVLDIDSEEDFKMMEFLHKYFCENDYDIKKVYETARLISCEY